MCGRWPTPSTRFADIDKLARVVPVEEIEANGFNLNISRYVQTGADAEAVDVAAEVAKLQDLIAKRNEAEAVMFEHLKRLGYVGDAAPMGGDRALPKLLGEAAAASTPAQEPADRGPSTLASSTLTQATAVGDLDQTLTDVASARERSTAGARVSFSTGTVLLPELATMVARPRLWRCPLNPDFIAFRRAKRCRPDFLFQWLQSEARWPRRARRRHVQDATAGRDPVFESAFPPLDEQRRIAEVLRSVDEAIAANRRALDQIGRVSGRHSTAAFRKRFGAVPLGLGSWQSGGTPSKVDASKRGGNIPWVCPRDMKTPVIRQTTQR